MTGWRHSKGSSNIGLGDSSSNSSTHGTVGVLSLQWLLFDFGGRQARAGRRTGDHRRQRRPDRRAPAAGPGSQRRLPRLYRGARAHRQRAPGAWSAPAPCWMPPTRATGRARAPWSRWRRRPRTASRPGWPPSPPTAPNGRLSGADHRHGHLAAGAAAHRRAARSRAVARAGAAGRTDHHRRAGAPARRAGRLCGRAGRTGQGARGGLGLPAQVFLSASTSHTSGRSSITAVPAIGQQAGTVNLDGSRSGSSVFLGVTLPLRRRPARGGADAGAQRRRQPAPANA